MTGSWIGGQPVQLTSDGSFGYWIGGAPYVVIGAAVLALSARGEGKGVGRLAAMNGAMGLAGKGTSQGKGWLGAVAPRLTLAGKSLAGLFGKAADLKLSMPLVGRGEAQAKGRLKFAGTLSLKGKGEAQGSGRALIEARYLIMRAAGRAMVFGKLHAQPFLERIVATTAFFRRRP